MKETITNDYDKAMPANAVIKCLICGEPILLEPREGYQVAVCEKCKKAVMRIREQSTTDVMPNKATPYVSLTTDPIIPYDSVNIPKGAVNLFKGEIKEMQKQEIKVIAEITKFIEEKHPNGESSWECEVCGENFVFNTYTPEKNGYKHCPNCGRRIEYVEELCKTYQP